jgi:hypothetical protein
MGIRVSLLVVLYNKRLADSETIKALLTISIKDVSIYIVNNGPDLLIEDEIIFKLRERCEFVSVQNYLTNKPLSWVYNDYIDSHEADRYIILDDDTQLTHEYFKDLVFNDENYMIGLPKMLSSYDKKQYTPMLNGKIKPDTYGHISGDFNFSITSAIILSKDIVSILKKRFGSVFDERYALYSIDNTLFLRLETIVKEEISPITYFSNVSLLHDFSNIQANKESKWRVEELLIANIITLRHYFKRGYRQVIKQIFTNLAHFHFRDCYLILRSYLQGKHPRCKQPR